MPSKTLPSKPPGQVARDLVGSIAPKLTDLTEYVLFDDVWKRPELSKRDRSLITVAALVALIAPSSSASTFRMRWRTA